MSTQDETENDSHEEKFSLFQKDIKKEYQFSEKIESFISNEEQHIFPDILLLSEDDFISNIENGVKIQLSDIYGDDIYSDKTLNILLEKKLNEARKKHNKHYDIIKNQWNIYEQKLKNKENISDFYLTNFRKHCVDTENYAYHYCGRRPKNFVIIKDTGSYRNNINNIKYVICIECKKVYFASFILCYCTKCNIEYYSSILEKNEDQNYMLATWKKYHCEQIIHDKMKCQKCNKNLYLNMKNGNLECLDKKCKFSSLPRNIIWKCISCKEEFKSDAIVYNPLEIEFIKKVIKQTLLTKQRAHPNRMPCCKLNVFFTDFYHKKDCNGVLYVGELNQKLIIVCIKCKAINFYDKFIWTCPKCGTKFRDKKNFKSRGELLPKNEAYEFTQRRTNRYFSQKQMNTEDFRKKMKESRVEAMVSPRKRRSFFSSNNINEDNNYNDNNNNRNDNNRNDDNKRSLKFDNDDDNNNNEKEKGYTPSSFKKSNRYNNNDKDNNENDEEPQSFQKTLSDKILEVKRNNKRANSKDKNQKVLKSRHSIKFQIDINSEDEEENDKNKEPNSPDPSMFRRRAKKERSTKEKDIGSVISLQTLNNDDEDNNNNNNKPNKYNRFRMQKEKREKEREEKEKEKLLEKEKKEKERKNNNNNNNNKYNNKRYNDNSENEEEEENDDNNNNNSDDDNNKYKKSKSNKVNTLDDDDEPNLNILNPLSLSTNFETKSLQKRVNNLLQKGKIPDFNMEEYTIQKHLGEGSYGVIYSVFNNKSKKKYAMKKIIAHDIEELETFHKEFEFVSQCKHKNIMEIYGITVKILDITTYALYVLMEMADYDWDKDIKTHLEKRKNYKEEELISILLQLVSALHYMQVSKKIAHRDIKPQNVLVFNNNNNIIYKMADFGEAKEVKISKQLNTLRGTELYMSPVLYNALKHEQDDVKHNAYKSDVFSLGYCLLYAAALNFNIIYEVRDVNNMDKIEKIMMRHLKNKYTNKLINVLILMLEVDENKRMDFVELYEYLKENFRDPDKE